jgi:hypothetical protein
LSGVTNAVESARKTFVVVRPSVEPGPAALPAGGGGGGGVSAGRDPGAAAGGAGLRPAGDRPARGAGPPTGGIGAPHGDGDPGSVNRRAPGTKPRVAGCGRPSSGPSTAKVHASTDTRPER